MMSAYIELAYRRRMGENAELLQVISTGTQGSARDINKLASKLRIQSS